MALTVTLPQLSTTQSPGVAFYARLQYDATGEYYDSADGALKPLANAVTPNIAFVESPSGSGNWSFTRDLSALPTGHYTLTAYEGAQNILAAELQSVFLVAGETLESTAATKVSLSHNTVTPDGLRYCAPNGTPIAGATIRVFEATDWLAGDTSSPVGTTTTGPDGRWTSPVAVPAGATYYIQFHLPGYYGPDVTSVTL